MQYAFCLISLSVAAWLAVAPLEAWGDSKLRTVIELTADAIPPERSGKAVCENFTKCLHEAAQTGDLFRVKQLLKDHPDGIDVADEQQQTALYWAVRKDRSKVTEFLLSKGAAPGVQTESKRGKKRKSALHWAVQNSSLPQLEMLLTNKANPNVSDYRGRTPLHNAARKCLFIHVRRLLEEGAAVNRQDKKGMTALHHARYCDEEVFRVLKQYGAKVNEPDKKGRTALHYLAGSTKSHILLQYLIKELGAKVDERDNRGRMPIHRAASFNTDRKVVKYLVDETRKTAKGSTLVSFGFSYDFWSDDSGRTPLHNAARSSKS